MDYFEKLIKKINENKYDIINSKIVLKNQLECNIINKYILSPEIIYLYKNYSTFELDWEWNGYKGFVNFVSSSQLELEHEYLVDIMRECYDVEQDEFQIREDIEHWYPLFKFPNGDAFCLDIRDGRVVFYEHEVYDMGTNLHGIVIALSIDDLYNKWSKCFFVDIYYWDEGVNVNGIDVSLDIYGGLNLN